MRERPELKGKDAERFIEKSIRNEHHLKKYASNKKTEYERLINIYEKLSKDKVEELMGHKLYEAEYREIIGDVLNQILSERKHEGNIKDK